MPGIELDQLGPHILASVRNRELEERVKAITDHLQSAIYLKILDPSEKTSPCHLSGPPVEEPFVVQENGVHFEMSFQSGYSQGIFLDQRDNRQKLRSVLEEGQTLLNTFAYTGAFSVFGALAGATTTTIDLSQPYLDWSKRNFQLNDIDVETQYFCKGDTFHWLKRFAKQGRRFDAIVLDPPTFSRDKNGKVFRVEKDYPRLVELASGCLAPGGTILACTNCRQIDEQGFKRQIRSAFRRPVHLESAPMPSDFTAPPYLKSVWIR
ncbi:class I SAM-dependent rRNA methyltransferase [Haloferula rosea]|nr:class I SAM-dependent methyltransferase [Haloferula rosea]